MKLRKFKIEKVGRNGWTEWIRPVDRGYLMACCDCGLVHRMDFRTMHGNIEFRAQRAPRYSNQLRKRSKRLYQRISK